MPGRLLAERHQDILVLTLDNPPANVMDRSLRFDLLDKLAAAEEDDEVAAILLTANGRIFSAGMDMNEFQTGLGEPVFREMLRRVEECTKPTVAAINGTALGGGLELALCCEKRILSTKARLGLPEVNIGVIPGAGGTQRLPRLVGVEAALGPITGGKPFGAQAALDMGAVDHIVPTDVPFVEAALAQMRLWADEGRLTVNSMESRPQPKVDDPALFDRWREKLHQQFPRRTAPQKALDAVELTTKLPYIEGLAAEAEIFETINLSPEGRALQHIFFAERKAAKPGGIAPDTRPRALSDIAIIGAGTMGCGIAINYLDAGLPVTMLDVSEESLAKGLANITKVYDRAVKRGRMSAETAAARLARLTQTQDYKQLSTADLVIEAVSESMAIKKAVFAALDGVAKPGAILASNTSTLDIDEIATSISRPGDVIGLHFFSPANIMRLVEIVRGARTADDVLLTALRMCKIIGKVGVTVGVCYGFVGNRMLEPYAREAHRLLLEGASVEAIDAALTDFGMSMGPLAVYDLAGNDIGAYMREENRAANAHDPSYYRIGDMLTERGELGQKTGMGFYVYDGGDRRVNPALQGMIEGEAERLGITRREISQTEIFERIMFSLIDEGLRCLDEGIAERPGDIDVIWCNGYGFPAWRGGPMHWADHFGASRIHEALKSYEATLGDYGAMWLSPSAPLTRIAQAGQKISEAFPADA